MAAFTEELLNGKLHFLCSAVLVVSIHGTKGLSATISKIVEMKSSSKATKTIEINMSSNTKGMSIYDVKIENLHYTFGFDTELHKIDRKELLMLYNP